MVSESPYLFYFPLCFYFPSICIAVSDLWIHFPLIHNLFGSVSTASVYSATPLPLSHQHSLFLNFQSSKNITFLALHSVRQFSVFYLSLYVYTRYYGTTTAQSHYPCSPETTFLILGFVLNSFFFSEGMLL